MNGAPGPLLAFCAALTLLALGVSQPLVLVVAAVGGAALVWRCPGPRWPTLLVGLVGVVTYALLNPLVAVQGDTVIVAGPHLPGRILDLEVTVEELVYGATAGLRMAAVVFACGLFVLRADPDRLTGLAARVAPRSALAVALAARLAPTLARDGSALADAARARGLALDDGGRGARLRARATLAPPLMAGALERGLATAEAMTARGYGAGRRTQAPARRTAGRERLLLLPAAGLVVVLVALRVAGAASFTAYPVLGDADRGAVLCAALASAALLGLAILVLERWTQPA